MRSIYVTAFTICLAATVFSQNNTTPYPASGNLGIGSGTLQSAAAFTLHVHGTTDYYEAGKGGGSPVSLGYTSRIGLTNTTTGLTANDGLLMRMSSLNFVIDNKENGNMTLTTGNVNFVLSGTNNRAWLGGTQSSNAEFAAFNISGSSDNGLYVRTLHAGKVGITIRSNTATDNAIQVMGTTGSTRNFSVKANGEVYARKYTTTLSAIPDYVFEPTYKLMSLEELRYYLATNKHLPNIPSAAEYAETGVDLGELNRLLLEKTEELTLYILQLEERIKRLEQKQ